MSIDIQRNSKVQRQADRTVQKAVTEFYGMLAGESASEIPQGYSALNKNLVDYIAHTEVRPGSIPINASGYSYAVSSWDEATDTITLDASHVFVTGTPVWIKLSDSSDSLPAPLAEDTEYWAIYTGGVTLKLATSYANAIAGTAIDFAASTVDAFVFLGPCRAHIEHEKRSQSIWLFGKEVYVSALVPSTFVRVPNTSPSRPTGPVTMRMLGEDVIIAANSGLFRVALDTDTEGINYVQRINDDLAIIPDVDINEDVPNGLVYGYWGIYSYTLLTGSGNRNRLSDSAVLITESATCKRTDGNRDYAERFFADAIGEDLANLHSWPALQLPDNVSRATHFSLYRTKNIGEASGGVSNQVDGIGNNKAQMVWTEDYPVAKAFRIDDPNGSTTLDIPAGDNNIEYLDYGDTVTLLNLSTEAEFDRTIDAVNPGARQFTISGAAIDDAHVAVLGQGRPFQATQSGFTITWSIPAAGGFVAADYGRLIFVSDGSFRTITHVVSATVANVAESGDFTDLACTIRDTTTNFTRTVNDIVLDDGATTGDDGLNQRILTKQDLFVPRRLFDPIPNPVDLMEIDSGFLVTANRKNNEFYYCQIGDKEQHIGYYRNPTQKKKVDSTITAIEKMPSLAIIVCSSKMIVLALDTSINIGNTEIGENIFQLREPTVVDNYVGVQAPGTIAFKSSSLFFAVTSEPAVRSFDGNRWSNHNYAIDIRTNLDAVQKEYIERMSLDEAAEAVYTKQSGYILMFKRYIET